MTSLWTRTRDPMYHSRHSALETRRVARPTRVGLEGYVEGDGGLEGGEGALSPFTHKPNYTVVFHADCAGR